MRRDPAPIKPSHPSLHKKASSSSDLTLQITPEKPNNSIGPPPPETRNGSTGLDEGGSLSYIEPPSGELLDSDGSASPHLLRFRSKANEFAANSEEAIDAPVELSVVTLRSIPMTNMFANPPAVYSGPPLPPAPTNFFARDEIMTQSLDHFDRVMSLILSGAVGVGKTTIALTLLHHDRIKARFGNNRHFIRCSDLANSLESFLEHLSSAIGLPPIGTMELLRPRLLARPSPLVLVLDGVEGILDPLAVDSKEITAAIEEVAQCRNVCILATSRMAIDISGFQTIEVPTISAHGARDMFYTLCSLDRSTVIDDLVETLDLHPLSVVLLAGAAREKTWDEPTLLREWDDGQADALELDENQSLAAAIESALAYPTIQRLGPAVQQTLEAISAFPDGLNETRVERMFPTISGAGAVVDVLCRFHLVERRDGFVRMLSPFRFHFLQRTLTIVQVREDVGNGEHRIVGEGEFVPCYTARGGSSQFRGMATGLTHLEVPPVFTAGPGTCGRGDNHLTPQGQTPVRPNRARTGQSPEFWD